MNENKLTVEDTISKAADDKLCNFEDLFQTARGMKKFETYSDRDLKKTLINHFFSDNGEANSENLELANQILETKQSDITAKNDSRSTSVVGYKIIKYPVDEFKLQVIKHKNQYMLDIHEDLIPLTETDLINALFFKLTKDIQAYHNGNVWEYQVYLNREFKEFLTEVTTESYLAKTLFPVKIWHLITGKKKAKINQCDPLLHIPVFPAVKWEPIHGTGYYQAKSLSEPWITLLYGISGIKQTQISLENSHYFSLSKLILNVSQTFDEIFSLASFLFRDQNRNGQLTPEDLFYKHISESFLPTLKIFSIIDHVSNTITLSPKHPLYTQHLIYLMSWCSMKWVIFLEKALNETRNYETNEGQTGEISLNDVFQRIREKAEQEMEEADPLPDDKFSLTHVEKKALVTRIDFYSQIIPELKKRLKSLLSHLVGDVISQYLQEKNLFLDYQIDDIGDLIYNKLLKSKSPVQKSMQSAPNNRQKSANHHEDQQQAYSDSDQKMSSDSSSDSQSANATVNLDDYSGYSRILGDFIIVLTSVAAALNENFNRENQLKVSRSMEEDRYDYLRSNEYFRSQSEEFSFEQIMKIQDCFDSIFNAKKVAIQVDQAVKNNINVEDIEMNFKRTKEQLKILFDLFEGSLDDISRLSQSQKKFQKYANLIKKYNLIYTDFTRRI